MKQETAALVAGDLKGLSEKAERGQLLRVERAAAYLDMSPKRIYQMIRERKLTAYRLSPRGMRVSATSLLDFVNRHNEEEFA